MITAQQLIQIIPYHDRKKTEQIVDAFNDSCRSWEINTRLRVCAYIAQLAHESGSFRYVKELASGEAYENRKDLGNTQKGDGIKFKGRGWIQITGRSNYISCGKALGLDLVSKPELLESIDNAAQSAGWFWKTHGLNELSDHGDFQLITKRINGGLNGYKERLEFYNKALNTIK